MYHKFPVFPFPAIVGQERMKQALLLNAVDSTIAGVLIKGDKGTGKSTAVRALARLLPPIKVVQGCSFNCHPSNVQFMCMRCQERYREEGSLPEIEKKMEVVDMPLSATEDMVVGMLDIKRVLKDGIKAFEPGLLARANRNILYIDEVNLLDDHLVNILLDAAAMGVNIVEREGVSFYHPSRFILVGTMNPEEGNLRPQILDRFGLCVEVEALSSPEERLRVMEYRRRFDEDPWRFNEEFAHEEELLRDTIIRARELLPDVDIPVPLLERIVRITSALGVRTHRADIVMEKTARALAALNGRNFVTEEDVEEAALLALPHRMRQQPFERERSLSRDAIRQLLKEENQNNTYTEEIFDFQKNRKFKVDPLIQGMRGEKEGWDKHPTEGRRGLYVKARANENTGNVALDATVKRAVRETGTLNVLPEHLMEKIRKGRGRSLYFILLDCSSSMRMDRKVKLAKSLAWQLLRRSYEKKSRVALMVFRRETPELLVAPTTDMLKIEEMLESVPTGGKTPLTPAIYAAFQEARKERGDSVKVILISDGRCNVFMKSSLDEDLEIIAAARGETEFIIINTEPRARSVGTLEKMAKVLDAPLWYIDELM